jgi:hypothetical protein
MGHEVSEETREAISETRTGMTFTSTHREAISVGKSGAKWLTHLDTDEERQVFRQVAEELVATGEWRLGRASSHRSRTTAGVR